MTSESRPSDFSILKIVLQDLGKQICLEDLQLFKAITKEEINNFYWTKTKKKNKCPNLVMSTKQFNKINLWVQKEVLQHVSTPKEVEVLSKFIKLFKYLLKLKNFQSAYAVKAALCSSSIHRLDLLWIKLPKKKLDMWERLCSVFSIENNYKNLRDAMDRSKLPCIPFLGVFLSDLTGLDSAYPKENGVETERRIIQMKKIYDSIWHYQQSIYDFKPHLGIQQYIQSMEYIEEFETLILNSYFDMSKALEPDSDSKTSDSSLSNSQNIIQLRIRNLSNRSYNSNKRASPDLNRPEIFRIISDDNKTYASISRPGTFASTISEQVNAIDTAWSDGIIISLIDDSEVLTQTEFNTNYIKPRHSELHQSMSNVSLCTGSTDLLNANQTTNALKTSSSFRLEDIETKFCGHYIDPDILTTNRELKLVLTGIVKRKIKSKSKIQKSSYQNVHLKLFINQLECFIHVYVPKTTKAKCVEDFKDENYETISLIDAKLRFDAMLADPQIFIELPNEMHIIRSIHDEHGTWPSLQTWWSSISESIDKVKASKVDAPSNLIDFALDCTRL